MAKIKGTRALKKKRKRTRRTKDEMEAISAAIHEVTGDAHHRLIIDAARHHLVADWEAKGWRVINDMAWCHHGRHAVLMELEG